MGQLIAIAGLAAEASLTQTVGRRLAPQCQLRDALRLAETREIGGQIFGEQLAPSRFRATEITIQARPGTFARFFVDLVQAAREARRFFQRTHREYRRFNYLGEWHSHPSFEVRPSETDKHSMRLIVEDPDFAAGFAVLMIVKRGPPGARSLAIRP